MLMLSVESRLAGPIGMSLTEFTYQVFQAYDWLHLLHEYNCILQVRITAVCCLRYSLPLDICCYSIWIFVLFTACYCKLFLTF